MGSNLIFMKKIYLLLVILLCASITSFAQTSPYFNFPSVDYSPTRAKAMYEQLKKYEINLPTQEKLKIVKGVLAKLLPDYNAVNLDKPTQDQNPRERPYWLLDFNGDKVIDLVLVLNVYFGPTYGYYFYFRHQGKFKYAFDNSGDFELIRHEGKRTILQYAIPIIDTPETQIVQTFVYDHRRQTYEASPKLYYASQTKIPSPLMRRPRLLSLRKASPLRHSPKVDNTPAKKLKVGEYHDYKATKTLWGNVVAKYGKGAKAYLLAKRKGWAFVAFLPNSKLIKTSLRHGMDEGYDSKTGKPLPPAISPYICGWLPLRLLN